MKKTNLIVAFSIAAVLSSCGGGSSPTTTNSLNVSGVAVDGYLSGSTVCLDLNINNACDAGEPSTKTKTDGTYALSFTEADQANPKFKTSPILIVGGTDIGLDTANPDNKPFVGSLKAMNTAEVGKTEINLSPATKMLADKVVKERKAKEDKGDTFDVSEAINLIAVNEEKVKKAFKIPLDKDLDLNVALPENRDIYKQSLSIHKAIETMVEAQVVEQKTGTETATSIDIMDSMYSVMFDTFDTDGFDFGATDLTSSMVEGMKTHTDMPAGAKKVADRAKKISETIEKAFDGFDSKKTASEATFDTSAMNRIEDIIALEFKALDKDLKTVDWESDAVVTSTTKITIADDVANDDFFTKNDVEFEKSIAIETLKFYDKYKDASDEDLGSLIKSIQSATATTNGADSVLDLFDDLAKFDEVIKNINTSTLTTKVLNLAGSLTAFVESEKEAIAKETKEQELEQAQNADALAISLPYVIYGVNERYNNNVLYLEAWEATLKADNPLSFVNENFNSTTKVWEVDSSTDTDVVLGASGWVVSNQGQGEEFSIGTTGDDLNKILLGNPITKKLKTTEFDVSGEEIYVNKVGYITMPAGSKRILINFEIVDDQYRLHQETNSWDSNTSAYTSFAEVINGRCMNSWFGGSSEGGYAFAGTDNDNGTYTCDSSATSGTIVAIENSSNGNTIVDNNAGTWSIKTENGVDILIAKPNNPRKYKDDNDELEYPIFAVYNGVVWQGGEYPKGSGESWYAYNKVAIDAIKAYVSTNANEIYNILPDSSNDDSSNGDDSNAPTSFASLISSRCGTNGDFESKNTDNNIKLTFECVDNTSATSGNLVAVDRTDFSNPSVLSGTVGTWGIETVNGVSILVTAPTTPSDWGNGGGVRIFAIKDGAVWGGWKRGDFAGKVYSGYNSIAIENIKTAVESVNTNGTNTEFNISAVNRVTLSNDTPLNIFWSPEYDTDNAEGVAGHVKYNTTSFSGGNITGETVGYQNSSWTTEENSHNEFYLQADGSWGDTKSYSIDDSNHFVISPYGRYEVYSKDISSESSTQILGKTITFDTGATRIYLKKIDSNALYYLSSEVN